MEFEFSEDDRTNHKIHSVVSDLLYLRFSEVFVSELGMVANVTCGCSCRFGCGLQVF